MRNGVTLMVYTYGASRIPEGHSAGENAGPLAPNARSRILEAAIELFGEHGFKGVSLKAIAAQAGVSAPLVIHHYQSKAGLRTACDRHVAEEFRKSKTESVRFKGPMPRNYALDAIYANRHLLKYMIQAFAAGGPNMDELFDRMIEDSLEYLAEAESLGLVHPSKNPRHRAVVIFLHSFGALMLHKQMEREFGVSPLDGDPKDLLPYMAAVLEVHTQPVINAEKYRELMESQEAFDRDIHNNVPEDAPGAESAVPATPQRRGTDR